MDKFKCPNCNRVFLPCDLVKTLCSENGVGSYVVSHCPDCLNKRPPVYSKLKVEGEQK